MCPIFNTKLIFQKILLLNLMFANRIYNDISNRIYNFHPGQYKIDYMIVPNTFFEHLSPL